MASYSGTNTKVTKYTSVPIQTSALGVPVTLFWGRQRISPNLIWYNNFKSHKSSSSGKGGGKSSSGYTYTAACILSLCEGPVRFNAVYNSDDTTTLSDLNATFYSGTASQTAPSWIKTNYPAQALSYPYTSYLFSSKMDLGSSASMPSIWCDLTHIPFTSAIGSPDVNLADVVPDFLTSTQYGVGNLTSSDIDSDTLESYRSYCRAQGIFLSPKLDSQEKATDILDRWAQLTNSWIFWGGQSVMFLPLGDAAVTGNDVTFTPDLDAAYDLTLADYLDSDEPVKVTRKDPADCTNRTRLEITDRSNQYNSYVCEYKDQTLVDQFGIVENGSVSASDICTKAIGAIVAELIGKRAAYIRNSFSIKLPYWFILLLPGSLLTITEDNLELSKYGIRVTDIEEDEDGVLTITAEEFPGILGTSAASDQQDTSSSSVSKLVDPGDVNTPCVFEPNSSYTGGTAEVLVAASGGPYWGGAYVYISFDNVTYTKVGEITSGAAQGVLTAALADASGLDQTNTLALDLAESESQIDTATPSDAANYRTLAVITPQPSSNILSNGGEILSYGAAATTGSYTTNLSYLERGIYGSAHAAHAAGAQFTQIDTTGTAGSVFSYALPTKYIGTTIYLKFVSYNIFGNAEQDITAVTAYQYVPTGAGYGSSTAGAPATPTGLTAAIGTSQLGVSWAANASTDNVTAYTLYAATGAGKAFSYATQIYSGLSTTYTYSGLANATSYTLFLTATNAAGTSSATSAEETTSAAGYGSVTSVGLSLPSALFDVTGSPVTETGTLTASLKTQTKNTVLAGPVSGDAAAPSFRALVAGDIPDLSGTYIAGPFSKAIDTAFGTTQGAVLYRGASAWALLPPGTAGQVLATQGAGANPKWVDQSGGGGAASATISGSDTGPAGQVSTAVGAHAYWRIYSAAEAGSENYISISNLEFRAVAGTTQQATGGSALSSGDYDSGYAKDYAFDANDSTTWISTNVLPNYIGYHFASAVACAEVVIRNRSGGYYAQVPAAFQVQYSDDGTTWITVLTETGVSWNGSQQTQTFTVPTSVYKDYYPTKLAALNDVSNTSPADGQVLAWDASSGAWIPKTLA
ncbi:MAG: phage tail protein [Rhizomicrobium sp.]